MNHIEKGWIDYERRVMPPKSKRATGQTAECRRAFFAGALVGFGELAYDDRLSIEKLKAIQRELEAYCKRMEKGLE